MRQKTTCDKSQTCDKIKVEGLKTRQTEQTAIFRTLLTPTNNPLPNLVVGVSLLVAPDVNLLLNFHRQGLP